MRSAGIDEPAHLHDVKPIGNSLVEPLGGAWAASTVPQRSIAAVNPAAIWPERMWLTMASIAACHSELGTFCGNAFVGDDARVAFRQRHEDQDAGAILGVGDAADDELFERGAMGAGARAARGPARTAAASR